MKLQRAEEHFGQLGFEHQAFLNRNPYRMLREHDLGRGGSLPLAGQSGRAAPLREVVEPDRRVRPFAQGGPRTHRDVPPIIPRDSDRFRALYRNRGAVEREFGNLKNHYALAPLRVRGLERVRLRADLVMLARLSLALSRAPVILLAA